MVHLWPSTVANGIITSITKVVFIILILVVNSHNCFQDYVTVSVGRDGFDLQALSRSCPVAKQRMARGDHCRCRLCFDHSDMGI